MKILEIVLGTVNPFCPANREWNQCYEQAVTEIRKFEKQQSGYSECDYMQTAIMRALYYTKPTVLGLQQEYLANQTLCSTLAAFYIEDICHAALQNENTVAMNCLARKIKECMHLEACSIEKLNTVLHFMCADYVKYLELMLSD